MPLINIIRAVPVSARKTLPPPGFSLRAVHTKKLNVIEQSPLLFADDYKYYHVQSSGRDTLAPRDRLVVDQQNQRRLWRIQLGPITGSSTPNHLALATAQNGSAEDVVWNLVNETIDAKIHELGMTGESPVTKSTQQKFELIGTAVVERLKNDLGLATTAVIRPATDLEPVETYRTKEFMVKLTDMRAEDTLKLSLEVVVQYPVDQAKRDALCAKLPDKDELTQRFQAATQTCLARNVKLHTFCYNEDNVRDLLIAECTKTLEDIGLRVETKDSQGATDAAVLSLALEWVNKFPLIFPTEATKVVECKVQPNLTPMAIHHTLTIALVDIAKWRKARIPGEDLRKWIDDRLDAITSNVLSEKTYVGVMTEFTRVASEIEELFGKEVESIGFDARQLITHTQNRELERILETRTFDVQTGDESYPTKSGTVRFGLRVAAQIKLADLDKVKRFIEPTVDFKAQFIEAIKAGAAQAIRKLDPEDLYTAFHEDHDQPVPAPTGATFYDVETELSNAKLAADELIKKHIRAELAAFNANQSESGLAADGKDIDLTFIPTVMDRIYSAIRPRVPKPLILEVEAQDEQGGETVTINTMYALHMAPKGWNRFHQQCINLLSDPDLNRQYTDERSLEAAVGMELVTTIERMVKQNMESKLSLLPLEFFVVPSAGGNRMAEAVALYGISPQLQSALEKGEDPHAQPDSVVKRLQEDFGIRISSRGFRIALTQSQIDLRNQRKGAWKHKEALVKVIQDNEIADAKELLPDDPQLKQRAQATEDAQKAANTAITQNSPLANSRENMRRMALELSNIFSLGDGSAESREPKQE